MNIDKISVSLLCARLIEFILYFIPIMLANWIYLPYRLKGYFSKWFYALNVRVMQLVFKTFTNNFPSKNVEETGGICIKRKLSKTWNMPHFRIFYNWPTIIPGKAIETEKNNLQFFLSLVLITDNCHLKSVEK